MDIAIIIQARLGSSRFPKKVLYDVGGYPLLSHLLNRLVPLKYPVIVAVPHGEAESFNFLDKNSVLLFEGEHEDVLKRYYDCATKHNVKTIIRVTGDNPLTSEYCLAYGLRIHLEKGYDLSHVLNIPHGAGVEYISYETLKTMQQKATTAFEREHVTQYAHQRETEFNIGKIPPPKGYESNLRVTVDTPEDMLRYEQWVKDIGLEKGSLSLEKVLEKEK